MATKKVIEQLVTELTADGAKMKKELDKSFKDTKTWGDKVTSVATKVSIGLAAGAGTVAVGLGALLKDTVSTGREIQNLSAIANVNAQEFQRIAFATKGYGREQDKLADILKDTGDKVGDFLQNGAGPLKDFFDNIAPSVGVTADQFKNLSGREALQLYVSSLEKANLSQNEMTFYMEAIASDATLLLPLLRNNGAELDRLAKKADNLGMVLSDADLLALKDVDQGFLEFEATLDAVGKKIAIDLLPNVQKLSDLLNDPNTQAGLNNIAKGLVYIAETGVDATSELGLLGDQIAANVANLSGQLNEVDKLKIEIRDIDRALKGGLSTPLGYIFTSKEELETLRAEKALLLEIAEGRKPDADTDGGPKAPAVEPPLNMESIKMELDFMKEVAAEAERMAKAKEAAQQRINQLYDSEVEAITRKMALATDASELERLRYEFEYGKLQDINDERKKELESMAAEIDLQQQIAVAVAEKAARNASLKEVEDLLKTEVERTNAAWDARVKIIEKAGLSAEREAELVTQAETKRAEELKAIHDQEMAELIARRQAQLAGAASLFGSLADLTEKFAGENSRIYKAMFVAEKAANIARAGVAIKTGIAEASSQPFPTNLAAMISVAAATSGLLSDIESINIAHGGLENVPKESTYLLDKGERVLSPKQNTDLTQFLDESRSGQGGMKVEIINNTGSGAFNASASMLNDQTLQIILTAVDTKLRQDLSAGRGVWRDGQHRYGWPTKGSI